MTNDRYRSAIDMHFGDLDIESKQQLRILMERRHFLTGRTFKGRQHQLDAAWNHIMGFSEKKDVYYVPVKVKPKFSVIVFDSRTMVRVKPHGFSKMQIRSKKTGRILKWEDGKNE